MTRTMLAFLIFASPAPLLAQAMPALGTGPITRAEVEARVRQQFAAMDANRDGAVTRAEFDAFRARQPQDGAGGEGGGFGHAGARWFDHADADGDGRVTLGEAEARPLRFFDMADVNKDGTVSVDEQRAAMALRRLGGGGK